MNVNPFSYLIEKLKSKFDKSGGTISGNVTIDRRNGTTVTEGESALLLGNDIAIGTDKNSSGAIYLWKGDKYLVMRPDTLNGNKSIVIPNNSGTLALTSDITPSSWDTYTVGARDLYVRKIGGMVEMYFWTDETLTATTTICTLADKYKPSLPTYPNLFVVHDYLANDDLEIYKDGKIKTVSSPKSGWKVFHATWGV